MPEGSVKPCPIPLQLSIPQTSVRQNAPCCQSQKAQISSNHNSAAQLLLSRNPSPCSKTFMTPARSVDCPEGISAQRTALVVDDVEDMLDLLEIALHGSNFAVLRASSASEAMEVFQARGGEIDLLMTDVRVGTESGLDLARRVLALRPNLPVLAISGFALDGKVAAGKSNINFLPKPFSTSELRSKLQSIFAPGSARLTVTVSSGSHGRYRVSAACTTETIRPTNTSARREGK
jgi:CheY-like chemotaxis protein